jgi:1,4-alpha-glucan branching enzyme
VPEGDGSTGESLPKPIKVKVEFKLKCPAASSVTVAGDFNDWNPERTPLKKEGNEWKTSIQLERGRSEYRFVVDGKWMDDPEARETIANPFGERNSVFSV